MIRRKRLSRKSRMQRRSVRRIAEESPEETEYKHWLHSQACVITGYVGELIQAAHMGDGGVGQKKGSWLKAVPMRADVHAEWDEHRGQFAGWSRERRRLQAREWIASVRAAFCR